jgi:acylglycerol lipase
MEELHMDIEVLLKQANKDLPLFLYGHSMGGLLVLSLGVRNPSLNIAGIVATSPLLGLPGDRKIDKSKIFFLKLIGKTLEV